MPVGFLFNTFAGLCVVAVAVVLGLCLVATPFLVVRRLGEIHACLEEIRRQVAGEHEGAAPAVETINRNVGFLVLNLPKWLKEGTGAR